MPLLIAAVCAVFIFTGLNKFGFWDSTKGPTAAFVPTIVCTMMLALCVIDFMKSFSKYYCNYLFIMIIYNYIKVLRLNYE